jgi:DNA polymerase-3 subunit delta
MSVHLLTGDDEALLSNATNDLVHELVGSGDRSLMVDDLDVSADGFEVRALVDAAQTMPFLTERRVVVGRGIGALTADQASPLVAYLDEPLESTDLVLVAGGGRIPKALTDAIKRAGGAVTATGAPTGKRDRSAWIDSQLAAAGVRLEPAATARLNSWLGEDVGRLHAIVETLTATYGTGRRLSLGEVVPFLGEAGDVPPWDLTDAIDGGDVTAALDLLARMMGAGERHPLQVMAILHGHYARLLKLDGVSVRGEQQAAEVLGVKSTFQAGKALKQYQRLGSEGVARAVQLLAGADLDLRGDKDWPPEMVMEVLVARLSRLTPAGAGRRR